MIPSMRPGLLLPCRRFYRSFCSAHSFTRRNKGHLCCACSYTLPGPSRKKGTCSDSIRDQTDIFGSKQVQVEGRALRMSGVPEVTRLDREVFTKTVPIQALRVPKQECHRYMQLLRGLVLVRRKMKAVLNDPTDPACRLVLLREDITDLDSPELPEKVKQDLQAKCIQGTTHDLAMDYSHLSFDAVMKADGQQTVQEILPQGWDVPSSFETIGHIAHLNLREEYLPYKHIIGQVIIDKNASIKTVVNKVGMLENQFRTLPLEVIAGEDRLVTTVKQHMTVFKLNYAEVYWNSRLEEEHKRLVESFQPGEVVADIMAGIGPFAIPAAQQGNLVYANDLNPRSVFYLRENMKLNKVGRSVRAFETDGREFIRRLAGGHSSEECMPATAPEPAARGAASESSPRMQNSGLAIPADGIVFHHAVMNLPASAVEFLDAFHGNFHPNTWRGHRLPLVHVYTFARTSETEDDLIRRAEAHLGGAIGREELKVRLVRDVAPNKRMHCITFRVPEYVAFSRKPQETEKAQEVDDCAPAKRAKLIL